MFGKVRIDSDLDEVAIRGHGEECEPHHERANNVDGSSIKLHEESSASQGRYEPGQGHDGGGDVRIEGWTRQLKDCHQVGRQDGKGAPFHKDEIDGEIQKWSNEFSFPEER